MTTIHEHLDLSKHKRNEHLDRMNKTIILFAVFAVTFILVRGY